MDDSSTQDDILSRERRPEIEEPAEDRTGMILQDSQLYVNAAIDALSANIAILDENGTILETNRSWQRFARENRLGSRDDSLGFNYFEVCQAAQGSAEDIEKAHEAAAGIRAVIAGELDEFTTEYAAHSPAEKRWCYMRVTRIAGPGPARVLVSHENVTPLKLAEQAVKEREGELEVQRQRLEETNTALRVLLRAREEDKFELEENVLANVKELVFPYIDNLKQTGLNLRQQAYLEIVESNLNDIISPFLRQLSSKYLNLTPREIQVANLVKEGRSTKEIAEILSVSTNAVDLHRKNVRKKLGLRSKKANLRTHLLSLG
jgi:DNA-binding CsgD family transcriptional regulator